ncbi:4-carboxy-2-hydroxymuconate-6-semialdehyde dehydrogenase [Anaerohalosphaera lusitana]|uniref:4-carboxy-2-hydroxymuconate-6-semialdehyde dehydrogenase n=1 Tax=Anaerohalosphaera lusitana TaxID=1936003 RepID=A0A1U9NHK4_9BACT|nr:Gfo/Idh/MocA family oxidoreductase [Anaerohalosphaera lusitana]AQT67412.1 4-carboxy-2-hydroxymuconate-6-semialdehyde dehydrogenase [Anaerohalosphaera lusitana]
MNRRDFIKSTSAATLGLGVMGLGSVAKAAPNEKVIVAVAGIRSRGNYLANKFAGLKNCEVKYVIDVDSRYLPSCAAGVEKTQGKKPQQISDFRKALDDKDVDAIVIATPDHWHAPMGIAALSAGKHVYVEKPCSHNPAEGELFVAAQKKYGKVVQMGNQRRSIGATQRMIKEIRDGVIGNPYFARTWYSRNRKPIGFGKEVDVPDYLDWDLWQGPAARTAYRSNVHPYNWHWFWRWGTGEALNNGTHELDIARWALGVEFPTKVTSLAGRYAYPDKDDWECFDTQNISIEFGGDKLITWEGISAGNTPINKQGRGVMILGDEGQIDYYADRYEVFDKNHNLVNKVDSVQADENADQTDTTDPGLKDNHAGNFIQAIRGVEKVNSPIDEGHKSVLLGHLGNIAARTGTMLECDAANGHIKNNKTAQALWSREYAPGWEPKI